MDANSRGGNVKHALLLAVILWAMPSFAQTQMACRDLKDSGGFLYAGETVVNGQACRQIAYAPGPQAALVNASAPSPDSKSVPVASAPAVESPKQPAATSERDTSSDGKIRVYVTDSQSWEVTGGSWYHSSFSANQNSASGQGNGGSYTAGGARPQTVEIIKTLNERCPQLTITNNLARASFVVTLDHEGGKGYLKHRNKIAVFNHDGDVIFSQSTRELGNAVKDACAAISAR
jgi:hypothetical protein